jgi:hypothetical protein
MKIRAILSAGLLVSFFLPWIDVIFSSYGGFQLPTLIGKLSGHQSPFSDSFSYLLYGLYLIPFCCVNNIIKDLGIAQIKRYFLNEFVIGLVYSAIILGLVLDTNTIDYFLNILSIGYYLTAGLSLIGLFVEIKSFVIKSRNRTQNAQWGKVTKKVFNGILLYVGASILFVIFNLSDTFLMMVFRAIFGVGVIVGCILIYKRLTDFKNILEGKDQKSIGKVRTAYIFVLINGAVTVACGFWFWEYFRDVSIVFGIIAAIYMLLGYSALKKSTTFPESARKGASILFVVSILLIAGSILNPTLIPIVHILAFLGWQIIKDA